MKQIYRKFFLNICCFSPQYWPSQGEVIVKTYDNNRLAPLYNTVLNALTHGIRQGMNEINI